MLRAQPFEPELCFCDFTHYSIPTPPRPTGKNYQYSLQSSRAQLSKVGEEPWHSSKWRPDSRSCIFTSGLKVKFEARDHSGEETFNPQPTLRVWNLVGSIYLNCAP